MKISISPMPATHGIVLHRVSHFIVLLCVVEPITVITTEPITEGHVKVSIMSSFTTLILI